MAGMSRTAGTVMDGLEHITQSVRDILGTPIGTRVGLRDYGSEVPEILDHPLIGANILRLYAATALALSRWEDRIRLRRVSLQLGEQPGRATLVLDADRTDLPPANARTRIALPLPRRSSPL